MIYLQFKEAKLYFSSHSFFPTPFGHLNRVTTLRPCLHLVISSVFRVPIGSLGLAVRDSKDAESLLKDAL